MSKKYLYNHRSAVRRHIFLAILLPVLALVGLVCFVIFKDLQKNSSGSASGAVQTIGQVLGDDTQRFTIEESLFTMQLPKDWKKVAQQNTSIEHSVTWQSTKKDQAARSLQIYIDTIPKTKSVNRLMPVTVQGATMTAGDVSDNCATFTGGGTLDTSKAVHNADAKARWSGVDFICSMANVIDNQVGVASSAGINEVPITGSQGTHKYFFLYIDRTIQPDYSILEDALSSFRAK